MSNPTLDSDLYGDIYGDEDNEYLDQPAEEQEYIEEEDPEIEVVNSNVDESTLVPQADLSPATLQPDVNLSLPPKPTASSPDLSYSAQVAKQFSVYQQTPSQERQQRTGIPLPPNPRTNSGRTSFAVPTTPMPTMTGAITTSGDTVFGKKPSEMHDSGKMFIGGLNWDTTDEGLRDYFSQFGKVDACTIMRDPSGTSRGFAFMTFEDASAVTPVLAREHILDGKAIDPKRAIPRDEHLRNTRYFVGGLSPNTTSDSMKLFFSTYGKVVDATVMLDRETGRGKGFGFVTFEDAVISDQLVGKIGLILDDKQIEVKAAQPRNQRDQARPSTTNTNPSTVEAAVVDQRILPATMNFMPQAQQNPMSMMYQQSMNHMPLAMMNMNPMMAMGMNGFNMMNGMPGVNLMGMDGMPGIGLRSGMGAMRMGMGPMGHLGMGTMGNPGMGNGMGTQNILRNASQVGNRPAGMMVGLPGSHVGRIAGGSTVGPNRSMTRGQHSFHPYAR